MLPRNTKRKRKLSKIQQIFEESSEESNSSNEGRGTFSEFFKPKNTPRRRR
jgi:hypothetical protein